MLEAKSLTIMPINDLDVYYCERMRSYTTLSLHVDGATVYTLDVRGVVKPLSGTGTVGAFTSSDKGSLVAWIDPVSGEFVSADSTVSDALYSIPIFIGVGVMLSAAFHLNKWLIASLFSVIIVAVCRRLLRGWKNDSELKAILRGARGWGAGWGQHEKFACVADIGNNLPCSPSNVTIKRFGK
ncbi:hypothetical protein [Trinickia acidisoli]|uniref:hypothetical protein n=1 Tax=Trinickia acidisoli TaxID=2767482 RepID=UPI001A8F07B0|nr:hypothetical protein [Trinickia acidisoli]